MKYKKYIVPFLWWVVIVAVVQYLFIAFVPNLIFAVAKNRSGQPLNTWIHVNRTDASLRRVVLPNPDFVYSACFYNLCDGDLLIQGDFPDSSQYCSIAFYGNDVQPYCVINNQGKMQGHYKILLTESNVTRGDLRVVYAKTRQGCILMRVLVTDSAQRPNAMKIQQGLELVPYK